MQVHAANVSLYNLNIANTYGKVRDIIKRRGAPLKRAGDEGSGPPVSPSPHWQTFEWWWSAGIIECG